MYDATDRLHDERQELTRQLSWLNTTIGDANEPILRAQVEHLQTELDKVNGQLDSNFSRLEEAGLGSVALAEKLAAALARIGELEDEIRALILEGKDREEGREGLVGVYKQRQAKRYVFPARQLGMVITSLAGSRTSK